MNAPVNLKAPFPYFGGKSRIADLVWQALGDVPNYVEPFAGSLAVLLARPHAPKTETVNDMDCLLTNFWRAVAMAPDEVAAYADWPVNEVDLEARHYWLVRQKDAVRDKMGDPDWFDAKVAGWWVWGLSVYIGAGWCDGAGPWRHDGERWSKSGDAGRGVCRKLPHLGSAGRGVHRALPHLGNAGMGVHRGGAHQLMRDLAARLRRVRVACGDWERVCGPSVTFKHGVTGVFLDPPYSLENRSEVYAHDCDDVARRVTVWALENGGRRDMRIIVCGYQGEHEALTDAGWRVEAWKAHGGYGSQGDGQGRANAHRERIWFSPHCLAPTQGRLL